MRIATYNCQGLNEINKREAIKEWAESRNIDVILLTETKYKGQAKEGNEDTTYTTYLASEEQDWTITRYGTKGEQARVGIMNNLFPDTLRTSHPTALVQTYASKTQRVAQH